MELNSVNFFDQEFAHTLLFKCPKCGQRIPTVRRSKDMGREQIDPFLFKVVCTCGWSGKLAGLVAMRHTVESCVGPPRPGPQ